MPLHLENTASALLLMYLYILHYHVVDDSFSEQIQVTSQCDFCFPSLSPFTAKKKLRT